MFIEDALTERLKEIRNQPRQEDAGAYQQIAEHMAEDLSNLGIYLNDPGFEKTGSGAPRFFEMQEDGTVRDALEGVDIRSAEFLDKVSMGRVFTFPAGEQDPVQLSINEEGNLKFSRPIHLDPVSEPQQPQLPPKPGLWQRFANNVFGAYKAEKAAYDEKKAQYDKEKEEYPEKLERYEEDQKNNKPFRAMTDMRTEEDMTAERERDIAEEENLLSVLRDKNYVSDLDARVEAMSNYFRPAPVRNETFTSRNGMDAPYQLEEFQLLKPIDISGIKVGGDQITDDQFAALSMCASMMEEHGGNVEWDERTGLTKEENTIYHAPMYTSDLAVIDDGQSGYRPVDDVGKYFGVAIQPGREYAKQALDEYQAGNAEKLGKLIAYGIKLQLHTTVHDTLDQLENLSSDVLVSRTAELLEKDPELRGAAKKAGLKEADLLAMKGMQVLAGVCRENERAEKLLRLDTNSRSPEGITERRRVSSIKARVQYVSVNETIRQHNDAREQDEEYVRNVREKLDHLMELQANPVQVRQGPNESNKDYARRMEEEQGPYNRQLLKAQADVVVYRGKHAGVPGIILEAGKFGPEAVEKLSNTLVPGQNMLDGLKGKELEKTLGATSKLLADGSLYARRRDTSERQKTIEKTVEKTAEKTAEKIRKKEKNLTQVRTI